MNTIKVATVAFSLFVLGGCATSPKVSPEARSFLDQQQQLLQQKPVSVVVDACVLRNEMKNDLVLIPESANATDVFAEKVRNALTEKNIQVQGVYKPFICSLVPEDRLAKLLLRKAAEAELVKASFPIQNPTVTPMDITSERVVETLLRKVNTVYALPVKDTKHITRSLGLHGSELERLRVLFNADKLFLIGVTGHQHSAGVKATAMAGSVLVGVLTAGTFVPVANTNDVRGYGVTLIDLQQGVIVWNTAGSFKGDIFKLSKEKPTITLSDELLVPLFPKVVKAS